MRLKNLHFMSVNFEDEKILAPPSKLKRLRITEIQKLKLQPLLVRNDDIVKRDYMIVTYLCSDHSCF